MAEGFTCAIDAIDEKYRSACKDLPKYPGSRYCVLHEPDEAKTKEDFLRVKKSKLDRKDYDFGGTVFPDGTSDFQEFEFDADANFEGAIFRGVASFSSAQFSGERTSFSGAQFSSKETDFSGAHFFSGERTTFSLAQLRGKETNFFKAQFSSKETDFSSANFFSGERTTFSRAQFSGGQTDFSSAQFSGERTNYSRAQFSGKQTSFREAQFSSEKTFFSGAEFGSVHTGFQKATFTKWVTFSEATFREKVTFWGTKENRGTKENLVFDSQAWVWFHDCRIETPELLTFNTVLLHPGWFINADVRKVDFTDVKWARISDEPEDDKPGDFKRAIQKLNGRVKDATEALKRLV